MHIIIRIETQAYFVRMRRFFLTSDTIGILGLLYLTACEN